MRNNGHFTLAEDVPTLAAAFAAAGYDTAAFVSSFVLDRQFGLARGFAHYDDALDQAPAGATDVARARASRRSHGGRRGGVARARRARRRTPPSSSGSTSTTRTTRTSPPSPFREQFAGRPYDGEIAFDDALVGALLDSERASAARRTLVVVAGDHGESLGEHGESTHGLFVYEAALRVPLIMAWPGRLAAAVVSEPVRLIDRGADDARPRRPGGARRRRRPQPARR